MLRVSNRGRRSFWSWKCCIWKILKGQCQETPNFRLKCGKAWQQFLGRLWPLCLETRRRQSASSVLSFIWCGGCLEVALCNLDPCSGKYISKSEILAKHLKYLYIYIWSVFKMATKAYQTYYIHNLQMFQSQVCAQRRKPWSPPMSCASMLRALWSMRAGWKRLRPIQRTGHGWVGPVGATPKWLLRMAKICMNMMMKHEFFLWFFEVSSCPRDFP